MAALCAVENGEFSPPCLWGSLFFDTVTAVALTVIGIAGSTSAIHMATGGAYSLLGIGLFWIVGEILTFTVRHYHYNMKQDAF